MFAPKKVRAASIEVLESRIAPALLVHGANLLGGSGNPSSGESSIGDDSVTLVKVLDGQAIVWFDGFSGDITGISFGPNTRLSITGNVFGDVVGNLTADGLLSDSDNNPANGEDGNVLLANNLLGLTTTPLTSQKGDVTNIVTGGSIDKVNISGAISGIFAGDGVYHPDSQIQELGVFSSDVFVDINPSLPGSQETFVFAKTDAEFKAGADISNLTIGTAASLQIIAGNGDPTSAGTSGAATAGGSVTNVKIRSAFVTPTAPTGLGSYAIYAGDGGNGGKGGDGGSIRNIVESQAAVLATFNAGNGGNGSSGRGGNGGDIANLDMQSDSTSYDLFAGNGGNGAPAGAGGNALNLNFVGRNPNTSLIVAADFTGDGVDDVIVVDSGTGAFLVIETSGDANEFNTVIQHGGAQPDVVSAVGATPVDAVASDFDGDGDLDLALAYANSDSLGIYFNDGNGRFYDNADVLQSLTIEIGGTPTHLGTGEFADGGQNDLVVVTADEIEDERVSIFTIFTNDNAGNFARRPGTTVIEDVVTDIAIRDGNGLDTVFAGFASGTILGMQPSGADSGEAFTFPDSEISIPGGVLSLAIDDEGENLIALGDGASAASQIAVGFTISGLNLTQTVASTLSTDTNSRVLQVAFSTDPDGDDFDDIVALFSLNSGGAALVTYAPLEVEIEGVPSVIFDPVSSIRSATPLKTFSVVGDDVDDDEDETLGFAAAGAVLNKVTFANESLSSLTDTPLPLAPKTINILAGDGGNGLNLGNLVGKGGAGGKITNVNLEAVSARFESGDGGSSVTGAAGAGGSIENKAASFKTAGGTVVFPKIRTQLGLVMISGDGGSASGTSGKSASGGSGGSINKLDITVETDLVQLLTGKGGNGGSGKGGNAGSMSKLTVKTQTGDLELITGNGGSSLAGAFAAGSGGNLTNFKWIQDRPEASEALELSNFIDIATGNGGNSTGGTGGAAGSITTLSLTVDGTPESFDPDTEVNLGLDGTIYASIETGDGGNGTVGGAGGSLKSLRTTSVHDDVTDEGLISLAEFILVAETGDGGTGSAGNGGAGGSIIQKGSDKLAGITYTDVHSPVDIFSPGAGALVLVTGDGGDGSLRGGTGGNIAGIQTPNSPAASGASISTTHLFSAVLFTGTGGDGGTANGGDGGTVSGSKIGVGGGPILVGTGDGGSTLGTTKAKGGAGGSVKDNYFGVVDSFAPEGLFVVTGNGGTGVSAGGIGGEISKLSLNALASLEGRSAALFAGDGGVATGSGGVGGTGGAIRGVTQTKDLNSAIDIIEAGNGGAAPLGTGGNGGNVDSIKVVGYIGKPSADGTRLGVMNESGDVQGVFSGRGGDGATDGKAGSVSNIVARQIAAISAAADAGLLFAKASSVSNVKASVIGYDVDLDGAFDSTESGSSPESATPIDGFVLATAISKVNTVLNPFLFVG